MASILRIVILRPNYVGPTAGIFQASFGNQKSFSVIPNLACHAFSNTVIKCTIVKSFPRHYSTFKDKESEFPFNIQNIQLQKRLKRPSKFEELNLHHLKPSTATEGMLINSFLRIVKTYYSNVDQFDFDKSLKEFVASKTFLKFCTMLENKLPEFSPASLVSLLNLHLFEVPPTSCLMRKVLALILENFNNFTLSEKVYLYVRLSQKDITDFEDYKEVKKVCEVYFKESFENDLYYMKYSDELLRFIELEALPEQVRKSIVKKLVDDAFVHSFKTLDMCILVETICRLSYNLLPRNDVLRLIKKRLYCAETGGVLTRLVSSYAKLLQNDESFYDKEVIDLVIAQCRRDCHQNRVLAALTLKLIVMGHVLNDLVQKIITITLSGNARSLDEGLLLSISNVLVRSSYQRESEIDPAVKNIRRLLESLDPFEKKFSFSELCTYCERLTYLGCDTRDWCSRIFKLVNEGSSHISGVGPQAEDSETDKEDPVNVLLLHHLAKACLSTGYEGLSDKMLHKMVKDELEEMKAFSFDDLNGYFGGEDYVLKGCTTPDKHCLHFVSLFGPDNKPIKLSKYIKKKKKMSHNGAFNIAEIERPVGSKMIAFQVFTDSQPIKFINEPRMSGMASMYLKMFESLDCHVVLLPLKFFKLPPKAKEEFLESQINEIIEKSETSESKMMEQ